MVPSSGIEAMVNGWLCKGTTEWHDKKTCWPGVQLIGGFCIITRVVLWGRGVNSALHARKLFV
jgi:hypothetical protein